MLRPHPKTVYNQVMYIHLTTHSAFSLREGLLSSTDLVQAAQTDGMPALRITDHNLLTGVIEFVTACKAAGIHPSHHRPGNKSK